MLFIVSGQGLVLTPKFIKLPNINSKGEISYLLMGVDFNFHRTKARLLITINQWFDMLAKEFFRIKFIHSTSLENQG